MNIKEGRNNKEEYDKIIIHYILNFYSKKI